MSWIRRSTRRDLRHRHEQAEDQLSPSTAPERMAAVMANEAMADGYDVLRRRRGRSPRSRLLRLEVLGDRIEESSRRTAAARTRADRCREEGVGRNAMSPLLWLPLAVVVGILEVALGRYVVALLAPDDTDFVITVATVAVAGIVVLTGHLAASAILTWVRSEAGEPVPRRARRLAIVDGLVAITVLGLFALGLRSADAEPGRWVLSYLTIAGSIAVWVQRPDPLVIRWVFHSARAARHHSVTALRWRRAIRTLRDLEREVHRTWATWTARRHIVHAIGAQWGVDLQLPSVKRVEEDQAYLVEAGLTVSPAEVAEVTRRLRSLAPGTSWRPAARERAD
ncbi:MAG: hypothetical protein AAFZ07_23250 [Actinomycetota bacterium]